ncbi:hypothetical protein L1987_16759 [Smallanthus sonchifolius]|uniref:Uncharacterized protein n=1 Tax=Smallanthus sonchifolius TaxID=185202 RepID=A0ACB9IX87_9ASTR|nr:hypothetical protein L1987_16759 [Smallanthus sonchifolius]
MTGGERAWQGGERPWQETRHNPSIDVPVLDDVDFDAIQWYGLSAVGKLTDFNQLCCLQNSFNKAGVNTLRMRAKRISTAKPGWGVWSRVHGESEQLGFRLAVVAPMTPTNRWIWGGRIWNEISLEELEATIKMGKELGEKLDNLEELVTSVIEGELESDMVQ